MTKLGEMARTRLPPSTTTMPPVPGQPTVPGAGAQYRLVVDNKTGRIIGSIPGNQSALAEVGAQVRGSGGQTPQRGRPASSVVLARKPASSATPTKPPQVVDLTRPGPGSHQTPARKAFPALSVTAKPEKTLPPAQAKRPELDAKVKKLLQLTPAKFTEWLIQQGLVRSEQFEHVGQARVKLKLGMYSDGKKFPHSGGYVWIQEGQSNKYTSVFKGSLFESAVNPTIMLKLMYHWSCQTNLTNVINWVKVDNKKIDEFFSLMRSVCVVAVQDEVKGLGRGVGNGQRGSNMVEVGVISLGTTTADGQKREVRVEVLGVLDRTTRQIRLRASEPIPGASQQQRFTKIFEMLPTWVHTSSKIFTDFSVDKETLNKIGFKNVSMCSLNNDKTVQADGNWAIMDYLKKVVPKMFQSTLSSLSTPVIQQFLDELTFRELYGHYPLACFEAIIQRISTQTAMCANKPQQMAETVTDYLCKVASDPFKDWRYSDRHGLHDIHVPINPSPRGSSPAIYKSPSPASNKRASSEESDESFIKRMKGSGKEMVPMESFYYATLPGDTGVQATEFKADMAFKCPVTRKIFMNNIEFMKFLHLQVDTQRETAIDIADLFQCQYCYKVRIRVCIASLLLEVII